MIRGRLSDLAGLLSGRITGPDVAFTGCGTDSRTLGAGELFLALSGPHHDGHEFVAEAQERGAAAAVVERPIAVSLPLLVVPDTLAALGSLAALWRARFPIPLVAVTGTNGKTTVKEMLLSILSRAGATAATRGNLNNEIGVPLCLFALDDTHRYAVMEMGANHPGEIARLCRIAEPSVAVVTCCAPAHLEGFGSVEGVARAKGEILAGLGPGGVAVINQDDDFAPRGIHSRASGVGLVSASVPALMFTADGWRRTVTGSPAADSCWRRRGGRRPYTCRYSGRTTC